MADDDAFTANGSTDVAFETKLGGDIRIAGVSVVGKMCGVCGQDQDYQQLFNTNTRDMRDGAGVFGKGSGYGVLGESLARGVCGIVTPLFTPGDPKGQIGGANSTGVLGEGHEDCPGVVGLCFTTGTRRAGSFGVRPGVLGVSRGQSRLNPDPAAKQDPKGRLGAGVVGLSVKEGITETLPLDAGDEDSLIELGDGTGVWGVSGSWIGVHGKSKSGRGGVFESKENSQLQLTPTKRPPGQQRTPLVTITNSPPELPRDGEAGDLIATLEDEPDPFTGTSLQARLWFCIRSVSDNRPAGWAQVSLGPTFDGG